MHQTSFFGSPFSWLGMGLNEEQHYSAIQSSQLAVVRAFVDAHPEMLNEVCSGSRRGRKKREELTIMGIL